MVPEKPTNALVPKECASLWQQSSITNSFSNRGEALGGGLAANDNVNFTVLYLYRQPQLQWVDGYSSHAITQKSASHSNSS